MELTRRFAIIILVTSLWLIITQLSALADGIVSVTPNSAAQGTSGLEIVIILDAAVFPPLPPLSIQPTSVTIGTIFGSDLIRSDNTTVSGTFTMPNDQAVGLAMVSVTFATPQGDLVYSKLDGFEVIDTNPQPDVIDYVSPISATPGDSDLILTVFLNQAEAPPTSDAVTSVTIGRLSGTDIQRNDSVVTANFTIPADESTGPKDISLTFDNPDGPCTYSEPDAFTVLPDISSSNYNIVDTNQTQCYHASALMTCAQAGQAFYGQDSQYEGNQPLYVDNGDGTVTDLNTGLMWQKDPDFDHDGDIDAADKMTVDEALGQAASFNLAGYDDWRLPTIKELYSLIQFDGTDPILELTDPTGLVPFINTDYFDFAYGDTDAGERVIDAQYASSTMYVSTTMNGQETVFGVNFADGRIKGYGIAPTPVQPDGKTFYVRYVRGETYGINNFQDNNDGTITDTETGLMWLQDDSGAFQIGDEQDGAVNWEDALEWAETLVYAGHDDWRLPNAKELQSIVDYTRAPDVTASAAIDPIFNCTEITNIVGQADYPFYWTGTTHVRYGGTGSAAVYVAFGRGLGTMNGMTAIDVHGAGCQRSDPKDGDPDHYPNLGNGPQGDLQRVFNYVRPVRDVASMPDNQPPATPNSPTGATFGRTSAAYTYNAVTSDPDADAVHYLFDWGDGSMSDWLGPYSSGVEISVENAWTEPGTYDVRVKAKDGQNAESDWSDVLTVAIYQHTVEQVISAEIQEKKIALDGLAFLTGDLCADTFFPPGQVTDFFGFQFLRDNDPDGRGHDREFLARVANNVLSIWTEAQLGQAVELAESQVTMINDYAYNRFPLMDAFRRLLANETLPGSPGLDPVQIQNYSIDLYRLDLRLSCQQAQLFGDIYRSLNQTQNDYLDTMTGAGFEAWPDVTNPVNPQDYPPDVFAALMTYAGEFFSWYAGSAESDTYFCPERHSAYFGSFYLKDIRAIQDPTDDNDPNLGQVESFLAVLTSDQADLITGLVDLQTENLDLIVQTRAAIATEFRRLMTEPAIDTNFVMGLAEVYGAAEGANVYHYASRFAQVGQSLSTAQQDSLLALRDLDDFPCYGAYLYLENIDLPEIMNTDFLFLASPNNPPQIAEISPITIWSGSPYQLDLTPFISDVDNDPADWSLSVSASEAISVRIDGLLLTLTGINLSLAILNENLTVSVSDLNETTSMFIDVAILPAGDVNGDGAVNLVDIDQLGQHILGNDDYAGPPPGDFNQDDRIDVLDILSLVNQLNAIQSEKRPR